MFGAVRVGLFDGYFTQRMSRALIEATLTTRAARGRLGNGVHWRRLDAEIHLGYRKGVRQGTWLVRWRQGRGYAQARVGIADDVLTAGTLSYEAAEKLAKAHVEAARRPSDSTVVPTVGVVVEAYLAERDEREIGRTGRPGQSDARRRLSRYVIGHPGHGKRKPIEPAALSSLSLAALSEADLANWLVALPSELAAATRVRLTNDLKAALNAGHRLHRHDVPPTLPGIIKEGLRRSSSLDDDEGANPIARENQILQDDQISRLVASAAVVDAEGGWEGDLFRIVAILAASGARFSQVARISVADLQISQARILLPRSRKGKRRDRNPIVTPIGVDVVAALEVAANGRDPRARLLERWRHRQIGPTRWVRDSRGPWRTSSELTRPWNLIREHAGLSDVIPYALRHSSIVRGIRAGLPIRLVAALHDTSVVMIERHYAKWITSGLEEMVRAAIVPLIDVDRGPPL